MRKELDDKLVAEFPNLYQDRHASRRHTAMCWGFECGNGWFDLIHELSAKLEAIILSHPTTERSWYKASQVKEKFGTLRFYMAGETQEMSEAIDEAERKSAVICEDCGQAGALHQRRGWLRTLCKACATAGEYELA